MNKTILLMCAILALCFCLPVAAQTTLPAPEWTHFPNGAVTRWGCEGHYAIIKTWKAVPGATVYRVASKAVTDSDPYHITSGLSWSWSSEPLEHRWTVNKGELTGVYVQGYSSDHGAGEITSKLLKQNNAEGTCEYGGGNSGYNNAPNWELVKAANAANAAGNFDSGFRAGAGREPKPVINTCLDLGPNYKVTVTAGVVQCQAVSGPGIGSQEVLDQGVQDAVDLWGWMPAPVEVCFQAMGRIVFIDTSTLPRTTMSLAARYEGGFTCATIDRIGIVVLLRMSQAEGDQVAQAPPAARQPMGCAATTTSHLNLRGGRGMDFSIIAQIPRGATVPVLDNSGYWVEVEYAGIAGFVGGAYFTLSGPC